MQALRRALPGSLERERKDSSYDTARQSLKRFLADFGDRPLASIACAEAIVWAEKVPPSARPVVVTAFNRAWMRSCSNATRSAEALLDADALEDLPGKWQAAILQAEQNQPSLRVIPSD